MQLKISYKLILDFNLLNIIFVSTVRVTLPVRSVSKGASFAFKPMLDSFAVRHFYF